VLYTGCHQVKINAAFYNAATGETTVTQAVSRTHKSKHHINTLAIQVRVEGCGGIYYVVVVGTGVAVLPLRAKEVEG